VHRVRKQVLVFFIQPFIATHVNQISLTLVKNYDMITLGIFHDSPSGFVRRIVESLEEGGYIMKTYMAKPGEVTRKWYVVDAKGKTLGRLASEIAKILRGKHKPQYTPHVDTGDFVIVINAAQVELTGKKWTDKIYYRHSGYPGGLKQFTASELRAKHPERLIEYAVKGMLPKGSLGRRQLKKLKVYAGADHPHAAQQPEVLEL